MAVVAKVQQLIQENPLIVLSKTFCPCCAQVKQLLKSLGATGKIIEVNNENDGGAMQAALVEISKQHTVPNIFIKGKHLGGCDVVILQMLVKPSSKEEMNTTSVHSSH